MKKFEEPKLVVVNFEIEDVVTTSEPEEDFGFFDNPCF